MLFCQVALLTCHIWHCCLIRVKAPYFYGSGILISLGKWGAGDRKVWKVDKDSVAEIAVAMVGKCGCPQSLMFPFFQLSQTHSCELCHIPTTLCPQKAQFSNEHICKMFVVVSERRICSALLQSSNSQSNHLLCFRFNRSWAQCEGKEVSPDLTTASLLPVSVGLICD